MVQLQSQGAKAGYREVEQAPELRRGHRCLRVNLPYWLLHVVVKKALWSHAGLLRWPSLWPYRATIDASPSSSQKSDDIQITPTHLLGSWDSACIPNILCFNTVFRSAHRESQPILAVVWVPGLNQSADFRPAARLNANPRTSECVMGTILESPVKVWLMWNFHQVLVTTSVLCFKPIISWSLCDDLITTHLSIGRHFGLTLTRGRMVFKSLVDFSFFLGFPWLFSTTL